MSQYQYVPARTNHLLHAILFVCTLSLWGPVWFITWLRNHNRTVLKQLPTPPLPPQAYAGGNSGAQLPYVHHQMPYSNPQVYPAPRGYPEPWTLLPKEVRDGQG